MEFLLFLNKSIIGSIMSYLRRNKIANVKYSWEYYQNMFLNYLQLRKDIESVKSLFCLHIKSQDMERN